MVDVFQLDTTFVVLLTREECFVRYIVWNSQESYKGIDVDELISYDIGIVCIFLNALPTQMPELRRAKKNECLKCLAPSLFYVFYCFSLYT